MTYTELAQNTNKLSQEELDAIQKGCVEDWMYESRTLCLDVYDHTKVGDKLSYEYMFFLPFVRKIITFCQKDFCG